MSDVVANFSQHRLEKAYINGEILAQAKPGTYDLVFVEFKVRRIHPSNPKLVMFFRIVTPGQCFGIVVAKYYGVIRGTSSAFKVGPKSDFARDYVDLFHETPVRWDRVPMTRFESVIIEGTIRTVTKGRAQKGGKQRTIPDALQYSVVQDLLRIKT